MSEVKINSATLSTQFESRIYFKIQTEENLNYKMTVDLSKKEFEYLQCKKLKNPVFLLEHFVTLEKSNRILYEYLKRSNEKSFLS